MISTTIIAASALTLNTLFIPLFGWIWSRENKIVKLETEVEMLKHESNENKELLEKKFSILINSITAMNDKFDCLKEELHQFQLSSLERRKS